MLLLLKLKFSIFFNLSKIFFWLNFWYECWIFDNIFYGHIFWKVILESKDTKTFFKNEKISQTKIFVNSFLFIAFFESPLSK